MGSTFFCAQGGEASLVGGLPHTIKDLPTAHTKWFTDEKEHEREIQLYEVIKC